MQNTHKLICIIFLSLFCYSDTCQAEKNDYLTQLQKAIQTVKDQDELYIVNDSVEFLREHSENENCEESFHVLDIEKLVDRFQLWKTQFPNIQPFYAVKVNNDPVLLKVLAMLGTSFDCASQLEIEQMLSLGVSPDRIIFANPRKAPTSLKYASSVGVNRMTFDSVEELAKMSHICKEGRFVLRIKTDDSHSANPLSSKFGATMEQAYGIMDFAFENGIDLYGIAFHVGSNCIHLDSYLKALANCKSLFDYWESKGKKLRLIDLGGGWPGLNDEAFIEISNAINVELNKLFDDVILIAEPGRYFATKTISAAMRIIGKNSYGEAEERSFAYFLTNGAYGLFLSSIYYNHDASQILTEGWNFKPLHSKPNSQRYPSLLFGPTCDPGDKILDAWLLPEMYTGEFVYSDNMGAYTLSLQTRFNGIIPSKGYYICEIRDLDSSFNATDAILIDY